MVNREYKAQLGYIESYMTNLSLPVTENLHCPPYNLSAQSAKWNIIILSVVGFSLRDKPRSDLTKPAVTPCEEATESYMVELIPGSGFRSSK
jgi:hypothetical protein